MCCDINFSSSSPELLISRFLFRFEESVGLGKRWQRQTNTSIRGEEVHVVCVKKTNKKKARFCLSVLVFLHSRFVLSVKWRFMILLGILPFPPPPKRGSLWKKKKRRKKRVNLWHQWSKPKRLKRSQLQKVGVSGESPGLCTDLWCSSSCFFFHLFHLKEEAETSTAAAEETPKKKKKKDKKSDVTQEEPKAEEEEEEMVVTEVS